MKDSFRNYVYTLINSKDHFFLLQDQDSVIHCENSLVDLKTSYSYDQELSDVLQFIDPGLFVYKRESIDSKGDPKIFSSCYVCLVPFSSNWIHFSIETVDMYKECMDLKTNVNVFNKHTFKSDFSGISIDPKNEELIGDTLKNHIISLPQFRLLHITGLIK